MLSHYKCYNRLWDSTLNVFLVNCVINGRNSQLFLTKLGRLPQGAQQSKEYGIEKTTIFEKHNGPFRRNSKLSISAVNFLLEFGVAHQTAASSRNNKKCQLSKLRSCENVGAKGNSRLFVCFRLPSIPPIGMNSLRKFFNS